jgi:hypothetical protein
MDYYQRGVKTYDIWNFTQIKDFAACRKIDDFLRWLVSLIFSDT